MKPTKLILTLSVIIVLTSLILLLITLEKYDITGFATDAGTANLTINNTASVTFTDDLCNFDSGFVSENSFFAIVYSNGTATINGTDWDTCDGLIIKNDGNTNVSVTMDSSSDAATFVTGTNATFKAIAVPSICNGISDTNITYSDFNSTPQTICSFWPASATADIDFELNIPIDAVSGSRGTVITATATAV